MAFSPPQDAIVYVGRLPLNLRSGPGPAFPSLAELQPGEALAVIGRSGRWLNVTRLATGETGWVHGDYVTGAPPAVPVVPVASHQASVGRLPLNLRSGPGPTFPSLAELQAGELLAVTGQAGRWLNVTRLATGETGWVHADYVSRALSAPLPVGTSPLPTPVVPAASDAVVADGPLNFRDGPGKNFHVSLRLPTGQGVTILTQSGAWALVQVPSGMRGWVMARYLRWVDAPPRQGTCRPGDVLADVHDPERLAVFDPCVTTSGTVAEISHNEDDDLTFRLALDPSYAYLLNAGNRNLLRGYLQVEVVPADQPLVAEPGLGAHVTVTGAYVLDTEYGWMEIHPAWFVGP